MSIEAKSQSTASVLSAESGEMGQARHWLYPNTLCPMAQLPRAIVALGRRTPIRGLPLAIARVRCDSNSGLRRWYRLLDFSEHSANAKNVVKSMPVIDANMLGQLSDPKRDASEIMP